MNTSPVTIITIRKPGDFRGVCRLAEWKPSDQCTPELQAAAATGEASSRWDHKRRCEVIAVECNETFDNAIDFERHFLEQHGAKPGMTRKGRSQVGYPGWTFHDANNQKQITAASVSRSMWSPPRLTEEGKAWKPDGKVTRACSGGCGFVLQIGGRDDQAVMDAHRAECSARPAEVPA